jgi:hypothetical protein
MDEQLLECGHHAPVKPGIGATWCPICNQIALVVEAPEPVRPGTVVEPVVANR